MNTTAIVMFIVGIIIGFILGQVIYIKPLIEKYLHPSSESSVSS